MLQLAIDGIKSWPTGPINNLHTLIAIKVSLDEASKDQACEAIAVAVAILNTYMNCVQAVVINGNRRYTGVTCTGHGKAAEL